MQLEKLKDVFAARHIEWRAARAGTRNGTPWILVLAYVTNRAIMDRLDEVCGPGNWRNEFTSGPGGGILCGISIRIGDEWVTKWDGAENTNIEAVKGGLSGAMKRAAVQWGIGRYLYDLDETFAEIAPKDARGPNVHYQPAARDNKHPAFKWFTPELPEWARQKGDDTSATGPGGGVEDIPDDGGPSPEEVEKYNEHKNGIVEIMQTSLFDEAERNECKRLIKGTNLAQIAAIHARYQREANERAKALQGDK